MTAGRLDGAGGKQDARGEQAPHSERIGEQAARAPRGEQAPPSPMRSAINWGLLGLIVERPTYAYDLGQRFERRYGSVLSLSNIGHVYTALGTLAARGLVEEIEGTRKGRQPKPRYRATEAGALAYRSWLVELAHEESRKRRLLVLALGALSEDSEQMREALDECERAWLQEGMGTSIDGGRRGPTARLCWTG